MGIVRRFKRWLAGRRRAKCAHEHVELTVISYTRVNRKKPKRKPPHQRVWHCTDCKARVTGVL